MTVDEVGDVDYLLMLFRVCTIKPECRLMTGRRLIRLSNRRTQYINERAILFNIRFNLCLR